MFSPFPRCGPDLRSIMAERNDHVDVKVSHGLCGETFRKLRGEKPQHRFRRGFLRPSCDAWALGFRGLRDEDHTLMEGDRH